MAGIKIVDLPPLGRDLASTDLLELSLAGGTGSRKITGQEIMNTSKLNIGTTAITSGTVGRVLFEGTGNVVSESANLFWDNTNGRFGLGTSTPATGLDVRSGFNLWVGGSHYFTGTAVSGLDASLVFRRAADNGWVRYALGAAGTVSFGYDAGTGETQIRTPNFITFLTNNTERIRIFGFGNVGINTTTDAGFRLDVNGTARVQGNAQFGTGFYWDNTNARLGIGTSSPSAIIHSVGSVTASGAIARGNFFNNTLVAAANNDALVGLDIQPTFTNGAFTGIENIPLRFVSQANSNVVKNILLKNIGTGNGAGVSIGFNNLNANNLSHAFIKSYYVTPSGMAMSFGTGGGSSLTSEGTTALVLNADQTANFTARVIANSGGFQATGVSANLLMSDNGTPVITRNGSTGIQFLKDAYWQTFSIFTNNTENLRVASSGNVLINTTTDAGFKLDVNGTARVQGNLTVGTGAGFELNFQNSTVGLYRSGSALRIGGFSGIEFLASNAALSSQTVRMALFDTGNLCIGNTISDVASARFIVNSTTQGFLPPRMTQTQRNAIASPAIGLEIYQTDATEGKYIYKSSGWTYIG